MKNIRRNAFAASTAILLAATLTVAPAQARDFFSSFMTMFTGSNAHDRSNAPEPPTALPFANEGDQNEQQQQPRYSQGASAFCVRTCDGRYFPISSGGGDRVKTCNSLCPASETKVVFGGGIEHAFTDKGQPYSSLPNAFRYRDETVAGCTCNGKTSGGLAQIGIDDDPTVRKGDKVADADGKLIPAPKTAASAANYTPRPRVARSGIPFFPAFAAQ
ncbi:MAG: DUF2865 domain-containing protein [Afipia sp.]|nr:DUF2865 domain-containing protein [Afipia sp.]